MPCRISVGGFFVGALVPFFTGHPIYWRPISRAVTRCYSGARSPRAFVMQKIDVARFKVDIARQHVCSRIPQKEAPSMSSRFDARRQGEPMAKNATSGAGSVPGNLPTSRRYSPNLRGRRRISHDAVVLSRYSYARPIGTGRRKLGGGPNTRAGISTILALFGRIRYLTMGL